MQNCFLIVCLGGGGLVERVGEHEFVLQHCLGTNPVKYSVQGWRHMSYSMGRTNLALELLRKSKRYCSISVVLTALVLIKFEKKREEKKYKCFSINMYVTCLSL